jgi:hypothetical protein
LAGLAGLALSSPALFTLVTRVLSEAYVSVTVFVAGTLVLIYGLEAAFKGDIGLLLARLRRWQVPLAALMGAFPGCGGAIVMVTQFTRGYISFGSLVATLTATMGDAMFLLLAREPMTGALIFGLGLAVGVVSGWLIDLIHGEDFLRPAARPNAQIGAVTETVAAPAGGRLLARAWLALAVPGLALGLADALQVDLAVLAASFQLETLALWLGVAGALLSLAVWARGAGEPTHSLRGDGPLADQATAGSTTIDRVVADTSFITTWVVLAFLAYELTVFVTGADLARLFALWGPLVPLAAIAVGFLPGCGPQIVVTTLYLSGSLPLSAQIGNAISNDGDALFPAIAMAPKAAAAASLYSAVPAFIVAYAVYWLF